MIFFSQAVFAQNIDALKSEVYSKLKCCACQVPFEKCSCPEAKEMKAYIDGLLESGLSKDEIFYRVAKKFTLNMIIDDEVKQGVEKRLISEAGEEIPHIIVDPASFNFGKVSKKQGKISKVFKLENKGNLRLIITNIRVSCSCITASLKVGKNKSPYFGIAGVALGWKEAIEPGRAAELEVLLDLTHPSMAVGKEMRDIFVASNDPVYPEISIRVEIEVAP